MTRALVTGSTGAVGANIVAALNARGIEVVGLQRKTSPQIALKGLDITPVIGDILNPESLRLAVKNVDWVFHAAAIADDWNYPADVIYRVNVEGARNVLQAAYEADVRRFVYTSSSAALGLPTHGGELLDETHPFNLKPEKWPYAHSKHLAMHVVDAFVEQGLHAVSVMPSAVLGPRDVKFISGQLLVRVLKGQILPFPQGGLNYIDGRDVAEGHILAAENGAPGERYLLAGHNMTHTETLQAIGDVVGRSPRRLRVPRWLLPPMAAVITLLHRAGIPMPIERGRVLAGGKYLYYDNSQAVQKLGLEIRPFIETVVDTHQWYMANNYYEKRGVPAERLQPHDG